MMHFNLYGKNFWVMVREIVKQYISSRFEFKLQPFAEYDAGNLRVELELKSSVKK